MVCVGPDEPNADYVHKIYEDVFKLLKDKYRIQYHDIENSSHFTSKSFQCDRDERNANLYKAIYSLVELDIWEGW